MIIKNLTSKVQSIKLEELVGGREFTLYVEGHGVTDIVGAYIPNAEKYNGIFEIGCICPSVSTHDISTIEEEVTEDKVEDDSNSEETEEEKKDIEPEVAEDKFICDICKAEFASARGLASHKNRVHSGE